MRYETERDVDMRLRNSVVMWENRPVVVQSVDNKDVVIVQDILTERASRVRVEALDLSPSSARLGYVIAENGTVYFAMRKPTRKFKQGLTPENFTAFNALEKPANKSILEMRTDLHPFTKGVAKTIMGAFPEIGDAFQQVRKGQKRIVPFSREWAIADKEDELCLLYRGDIVGYVGKDSVSLLPDKFFLKESLELCLK